MPKVNHHCPLHAMLLGMLAVLTLPAAAIPVDESIIPSSAAEREAHQRAAKKARESNNKLKQSEADRLRIEREKQQLLDEKARAEADRIKAEAEKAKVDAENQRIAEDNRRLRAELERANKPIATVPSTPVNLAYEPTMVSIPAGSFTMGCSRNLWMVGSRDKDCSYRGNEEPSHTVHLSAFELGKYEVTQGQWKAVMGSPTPELRFKDCGDTCPVERVSWDDIQIFIQKLNAMTGKSYRLPSEAEWELPAVQDKAITTAVATMSIVWRGTATTVARKCTLWEANNPMLGVYTT